MKDYALVVTATIIFILGCLFMHRGTQLREAKLSAQKQRNRIAALEVSLKYATRPRLPATRSPVAPIVRIRSYKPQPRRVSTWLEDHPSWTVMPDKLQWWEKRTLTAVSKVLVKGANLKELHTFLGVQIEVMKICPAIGEHKCIQMVGMMMVNVDRHLKAMMTKHSQPLATAWWKDPMTAHGVPGVLPSNDNLKKLHIFLGKQIQKLGSCINNFGWVVDTLPGCKRRLSKSVVEIDTYFKKIVNDHGGPLIDRDWNRH